MKISEQLIQQWLDEYFTAPVRERYEIFIAEKAAAWVQERCAKVCDELRVKGGQEWSADHLGALQGLTEAGTAIRALTGEGA